MQSAIGRTFASLKVRNFRLYFIGQGVSLCGTWMRMVALSWLVLQLTHSGTQLGLILAAQFLPILFFGMFGGVIVDRHDNKRLLLMTQVALGAISLMLGLLVTTHVVHMWMVYVLAAMSGVVIIVDNPTRQTFVVQMVGESRLKNAVTLNSTLTNVARIVGPSIAATLIAFIGIGLCFLVDAGTFLGVLIALLMMHRKDLFHVERAPRQAGQLRAGLRYVRNTPALRTTIIMMVLIGTFAYEYPVTLPLIATGTFHGNATTYSLMATAMGAGAIVGGLYSAGKGKARLRTLILVAILFGVSMVVTALAPNLIIGLILLVIMGALSVLFIALGNTTLQLTAAPQMRGRVMSLWYLAFQGTTPIGGPIVGAIADHSNPRFGLLVGGAASILAAGVGSLAAGYKLPSRATANAMPEEPHDKTVD
jgi:MFS family permease